MHNEGYLARQERSPALLLGVVGVHVALITAIALSPVRITLDPDIGITVTTIPADPPKPIEQRPIEPVRKPVDGPAKPRTADPVAGPDTSADVMTGGDAVAFGGGGAGTGVDDTPIVIPDIEPVAEPVLVGARDDPRFARDLQPPYPPAMQRAEMEGSVTVRVLIGVDGRVLRVEAVRVDQEAFLATTREWALRKWRFRPATRDGAPYEAWIVKTVRFTLGD
jgi:periplasmic protein TonB